MSDSRAQARQVFEMCYEWGGVAEACYWQAVGQKVLEAARFTYRLPQKEGESEGKLARGVVFTSVADKPQQNDEYMAAEVASLGRERQAQYIRTLLTPDLRYLLEAAERGEIAMDVIGAAAREDVPVTEVMARGIDGTY